MVNKYVKALENRELNSRTGEIWTINDVPTVWKSKVEQRIEDDGYVVDTDGTVIPKPENE